MILGAQIGLLIYGIITLIKGQYSMGKGKKVVGSKARVLGVVCVVPLPLSALVGIVIGLLRFESLSDNQFSAMVSGIEVAILVCAITALVLLAKTYYREQQQAVESI